MQRIFGIGAKKDAKPAPTLAEAAQHLDGRVQHIDAQIAKCDQELAVFKQQLAKARGAAANPIKQRALVVLKRKKMYEQQRDGLLGTQFNIDQAAFTTEQIQTTLLTVDAMKAANVAMKKEFKKVDIGKIEAMQDDMEDMMFDAQEINEILGRSYAVPDGCDEAALEAELAGLEDELAMEASSSAVGGGVIPSYLPTGPAVPTGPIAGQQQQQPIAESDRLF